MKLISAQALKFRNIIDTTIIEIDEKVTCLVGKNESGKTSFLHSLYRLNPARENVAFSIPNHYPAWREKSDKRNGIDLGKERPIHANFLLESIEIQEVQNTFGEKCLDNFEISLSRNYNGVFFYGINTNEIEGIKNFVNSINLDEKLNEEISNVSNFGDLLSLFEKILSRENVSVEKKDMITNLTKKIEELIPDAKFNKAVYNFIKKFIPKFFYFDKYSTLPYSVEIKNLLEADESDLDDGEITARSLLRQAAADDEYLTNPDYERRKRELENIANALTNDVLIYWSQNKNLRVTPDVTQKTVNTPNGQESVIDEIKFRIWDGRHSLSLPFDEHSTGFQWFFSFLAAFSEFEYTNEPVIILLDEPALGLHAKAQEDYLKFIEERIATTFQVIYSTHSPFMIDPKKLERVRLVEDKDITVGSVITSEVMSTDKDTLFPLQSALGYDLAQHLFISPNNLVVEGTSDFTYMSVMSNFLMELDGREYLNEKWTIVPVGGADLIPTFVALLGNQLDLTVIVDSQKAGHKKLSNLKKKGYLKGKRIITIGEILKTKLADIEDLFEPEDYLNIYNLSFGESITLGDLKGSDSIVAKIARHKKIDRFNHGKPADYFLRNRDVLLPGLSEKTISNYEKLISKINLTMLVN